MPVFENRSKIFNKWTADLIKLYIRPQLIKLMQKRPVWIVILFTLITLGIYGLYWLIKTKGDLCKAGADIPTSWLLIIPIANLYYIYKWSMGVAKVLRKNDSFGYIVFLFWIVFSLIAIAISQNEINKFTGRRK